MMFRIYLISLPFISWVRVYLRHSYDVQFTIWTSSSLYEHPVHYIHIQFTIFTSSSLYSHPVYYIHIQFTIFKSSSLYSHPVHYIHIQFTMWTSSSLYVVRCAIWYHFFNLKNVKNSHGGVLILVKLQASLQL